MQVLVPISVAYKLIKIMRSALHWSWRKPDSEHTASMTFKEFDISSDEDHLTGKGLITVMVWRQVGLAG